MALHVFSHRSLRFPPMPLRVAQTAGGGIQLKPNKFKNNTPQIAYKVAICPRRNLPYKCTYFINHTNKKAYMCLTLAAWLCYDAKMVWLN